MEIILTRYNKYVYNKFNKKTANEYVLNIDKIMKNKLEENISVLNIYQVFILNYEIKKLLTKVVGKSYDKIIYVNQNISVSYVLNLMQLFNTSYPNETFEYTFYYNSDDDQLVKSLRKLCPDMTFVDYEKKSSC